MAVTILETIKSAANASNTAYIVVVKLLCDSYSDLPTQFGLTGYELAQGCIAHVINEDRDYMITSAGVWEPNGGQMWANVYTKSETDALLDDKQDELTTAQLAAVNSGITTAKVQQYDDTVTDEAEDRAALVELVDSGAKNKFITATTSSTITDCTFTNNGDGTWTTTSSGAVADRRQKSLKFNVPTLQNGDYVLSGCPSGGASGTTIYYCLYVWDTTENVRVSSNDVGRGIIFSWNPNPTHSYNIAIDIRKETNPNGLIFKPMICTLADWKVSQKFVPYCPSMQEMYQMILALQ